MKRRVRSAGSTLLRPGFFLTALLAFGLVSAATIGTAPVWKIGRAAVEWRPSSVNVPQSAAGQTVPVLKISLRNEGGAGNLPVRIFGRWSAPPVPPAAFVLLASYDQQVALVQTAIVEAPLVALSNAPPGKLALEIAVLTGTQETDRKSIPWN